MFGMSRRKASEPEVEPRNPANDGEWWLWQHKYPPVGVLIQVSRLDGQQPIVTYPEDIHPELNVHELFWRLTGIGKMQLEAANVE